MPLLERPAATAVAQKIDLELNKPEVIGVSQVMSDRDHRAAPGPGFSLPEPKFHPPGTRPGIVGRTALVERLAAAQEPVITVTAPPGYGKTTLMAQWAGRPGSRVAWLSCDDADNDPVVLLSALAIAIGRIGPVAPAIFPALASSGAGVTMVPRFVSAVASIQPPVTVLLDQAEAVTNRQCLNVIAEFALRLPPGWRFALASRTAVPLPAARLRAQGGLLEITADDLAMGAVEADALLRGAGVTVNGKGLDDLLRRTEGWPTGLYIAALAMKAGTRRSKAGFTFTGDDVFMGDYLRSELLDRISGTEVSFLTRTSVLGRCAGRSAMRSWTQRDPGPFSNSWKPGTCWWSRLTGAGSGTATTICSGTSCGQNSGAESPRLVQDLHFRAAVWFEANAMPEAAIDHAQRRETTTGWPG